MRILFSSDFHASAPAVSLFADALAMGPFDAGIIAGDILDDFWVPDGSAGGIEEVERQFKEILSAGGKPVYVIPGNHDPTAWEDFGNVINIHGRRLELDGYSFVGYRWTTLERSEEEQKKELRGYDALMDRKTILVTHEPPFGKLDLTGYDSLHHGSKAIAHFAWRNRPRFHLFGHVHGGFGVRWRAVNGSYPNSRSFYDIDLAEGMAHAIPAEVAMEDTAEV